jgi:hypothetical protein
MTGACARRACARGRYFMRKVRSARMFCDYGKGSPDETRSD